MKKQKLVILGAGLTGLSLAYFLKDQDLEIHIIEARDRIGGRIHTIKDENQAPVEMGATWLGSQHQTLIKLIQELELNTFIQKLGNTAFYEPISTSPPSLVQLPPNDAPSFRIVDGSSVLIDTLANYINPKNIHVAISVKNIQFFDHQFIIQTNDNELKADYIVSTLPPFLLTESITCEPDWPKDIRQLSVQTHTWMGESIKIALRFAKPFWNANRSSGTMFSNVGPVTELYDHSDFENERFALKGFLNGAYYNLNKAERLEIILKQLSRYYGEEIRNFTEYHETVWRKEKETFMDYPGHVLPHQNNGHPLYSQPLFDGRFHIGGAETSPTHPGYMDGAVVSATNIAKKLIDRLKNV